MPLNGASNLLCKWNSKTPSSAEVTGASSIICSGSLIGCNCLSPKLASAMFESITSTENAGMHSHTVPTTNGNEQLFLPAEYYRRVPPSFYYDDNDDTPF